MGYDDCSWCMGGSDDRGSVGAATSMTLEL